MEKLSHEELLKFEYMCRDQGATVIGGVDEAGRGPLAGPVVAACVIFDLGKPFPEANDSKKLTEKQREKLYDDIIASCVSYGIGSASNEKIDEVNILQATYIAMREAVEKAILGLPEGLRLTDLLVDHVHIPNLDRNILQRSITHGDALSVSIGAASILAKVTRDRYMTEMDLKYPGYGFSKHKGYGTKVHYEALETLGPSEIHRKSFIKNVILKN